MKTTCKTCKWKEAEYVPPTGKYPNETVMYINVTLPLLCLHPSIYNLVTEEHMSCDGARYELHNGVHIPGMLCGGRLWDALNKE